MLFVVTSSDSKTERKFETLELALQYVYNSYEITDWAADDDGMDPIWMRYIDCYEKFSKTSIKITLPPRTKRMSETISNLMKGDSNC